MTTSDSTRRSRPLALLAGLLIVALFAVSCSGDARTDTSTSADDAAETTSSSSSSDDSSSDDADTEETVDLTQSGEVVEFTVQTGVPATSVYHALIVTWGERIDVMSGGRLQADVVPSGAIVGALEILDAVDDGTMEAGFAWSNYWNGKNKAAALFSNPPAGSTGMDQSTSLAWMYDGGGLELYAELYQSEIGVDVIPLPVAPMGPDPFGWFNEVITSVEDVKGLKYRSPPGLPGDSFNELGMEAIAMPGSEIIPAAVWDNYYLQGIHQSTDIGELLLNKTWYDGLPPDLQMIIKVAAQATIVDSQTPKEFYPEFINAWNTVAEGLEAEDPFFKKVRDSQKAYAESVMPYRLTITELYQTIGETYYPELVGSDPS